MESLSSFCPSSRPRKNKYNRPCFNLRLDLGKRQQSFPSLLIIDKMSARQSHCFINAHSITKHRNRSFWKFSAPLAFMKDVRCYLFLRTKINAKRILAFRKKRQKAKEHSAFVLRGAVMEAAARERDSGPPRSSPGTALSTSASNRHGFHLCLGASVLYLDVVCASISEVSCGDCFLAVCHFGFQMVL